MDEGDRPEPRIDEASGTVFAQTTFHHGEEDAQHRALQGCVALQEVSAAVWARRVPIAAPVAAERCDRPGAPPFRPLAVYCTTYAATFAGVRDQEITVGGRSTTAESVVQVDG